VEIIGGGIMKKTGSGGINSPGIDLAPIRRGKKSKGSWTKYPVGHRGFHSQTKKKKFHSPGEDYS